jgi:quinol monooxygenase YgiN
MRPPAGRRMGVARARPGGYTGAMIHVIATIDLNEGTREAFLAEFYRLMPEVLAEAGCVEYGPAIEIPTTIPVQSPPRQNSVTVIEKWADVAALQAHLKAPHMAAYRERVRDHVKSVTLQVLESALPA